jgi:hypothetical protein
LTHEKIGLIIASVLLLSIGANAQAVWSIGADTAYFQLPAPSGYEDAKIKFSNPTSRDIDIEWRVVSVDTPVGWTSTGVCDWNTCLPFPIVGWRTSVLPANSTNQEFKVGVRRMEANTIGGCSKVILEFKDDNGGPNRFVQFRHTNGTDLNCFPVSVRNVKKDLVNVYPNPTRNYINLNVVDEKVKSVQLSNIIGRQIQRVNMTEGKSSIYQMSLQGLPKGIYILQFKDKSNKVVGVKRITKR